MLNELSTEKGNQCLVYLHNPYRSKETVYCLLWLALSWCGFDVHFCTFMVRFSQFSSSMGTVRTSLCVCMYRYVCIFFLELPCWTHGFVKIQRFGIGVMLGFALLNIKEIDRHIGLIYFKYHPFSWYCSEMEEIWYIFVSDFGNFCNTVDSLKQAALWCLVYRSVK